MPKPQLCGSVVLPDVDSAFVSRANDKLVVDEKEPNQDIDRVTDDAVDCWQNEHTINTKIGRAKLLHPRSDGIDVFELPWRLANGSKALMYSPRVETMKSKIETLGAKVRNKRKKRKKKKKQRKFYHAKKVEHESC